MAKRNYTVFCDESAKRGPHFSYFYGGVVVADEDREAIESALRSKKEELNLFQEIKWTKITDNYRQKYIDFIRFYFEFISSKRLKVRILFCHNYLRPTNLNSYHQENRYFLLYYQLIKHGFGFKYSNPNEIDRVFISVILDDLPDTKEKISNFKEYVSAISSTNSYTGTNVFFPKDRIGEANSKDHAILQGLDIILGSMHFRLNDLHLAKPEGKRRRAKRTVAKENVYKEINRQIRAIYPNFNIGISTGTPNGLSDRWNHPYAHWCFVPSEYEIDSSAGKHKAPPAST